METTQFIIGLVFSVGLTFLGFGILDRSVRSLDIAERERFYSTRPFPKLYQAATWGLSLSVFFVIGNTILVLTWGLITLALESYENKRIKQIMEELDIATAFQNRVRLGSTLGTTGMLLFVALLMYDAALVDAA
jgi:hypothetical protein